jgi:hypothetical protein
VIAKNNKNRKTGNYTWDRQRIERADAFIRPLFIVSIKSGMKITAFYDGGLPLTIHLAVD